MIQGELRRTRGNRKRAVKNVQTAIRRRLRQEGLAARVLGREKHIYSVYRKMRAKRLPLEQVLDVYGIRILVDSVDMCYRVLGSVHNLYKPRPGRFKDYIAIPKANGYQSLHTVLFGPRGLPIEVQIRSSEMHEIAESGIAAHVLYKDGNARNSVAHRRARTWMQEILEMQKTAGDPVEFIEHVKVDLFPDTVFVFTRRPRDPRARARGPPPSTSRTRSTPTSGTPARRPASTVGRPPSAPPSRPGRRWRS